MTEFLAGMFMGLIVGVVSVVCVSRPGRDRVADFILALRDRYVLETDAQEREADEHIGRACKWLCETDSGKHLLAHFISESIVGPHRSRTLTSEIELARRSGQAEVVTKIIAVGMVAARPKKETGNA